MGGTLTNLIFHVIFSTRNRHNLITYEFRDELYRYIGGIINKEGGTLIIIGAMPDHIHILIKLRPVHSLSDIMRKVKGGSSKWINKENKLNLKFAWQDGYGVFSVSESQVQSVIQYVEGQEKHHSMVSFKDEFLHYLKRHEVEYDEQYIWK